MERIFIFIKHNFGILWKIIDYVNGVIFSWLFKLRLEQASTDVFSKVENSSLIYRRLGSRDVQSLCKLIGSQKPEDLKFFQPHGFDLASLDEQSRKRGFFMMGVYDKQKLVGYFFLRFFANKKCFVGRLIDKDYRGLGIGTKMNTIMYEIAWLMGFRCLSTISRKNEAVINAHSKNQNIIVLKELKNDYILIEFVREADDKKAKRLNTATHK